MRGMGAADCSMNPSSSSLNAEVVQGAPEEHRGCMAGKHVGRVVIDTCPIEHLQLLAYRAVGRIIQTVPYDRIGHAAGRNRRLVYAARGALIEVGQAWSACPRLP